MAAVVFKIPMPSRMERVITMQAQACANAVKTPLHPRADLEISEDLRRSLKIFEDLRLHAQATLLYFLDLFDLTSPDPANYIEAVQGAICATSDKESIGNVQKTAMVFRVSHVYVFPERPLFSTKRMHLFKPAYRVDR